jgi:hypothetical protein
MTRNVVFGWINTNSILSENKIPTLWIGERNLKLGSKNDIDLVILDGFTNFTKDYLSQLENVGYNIINATNIFHTFSKKYSLLNRFGDYEKKCFLRWLVLENLYGDESVIHFDGDIVFNETPENLQKRFEKYTFVLQGCPALVSINNHNWYNQYVKNLNLFIDDIEKYSSDAWEKRTGWEISYRDNWAGSRYREIITSDQDLISHLLHIHDLPQEKPSTIIQKNQDIILFENPLYFFSHNMDCLPFDYKRLGLIDYFNEKKVAFWHMQSNFSYYLRLAYFWCYVLKFKIKIQNDLEKSNFSSMQNIQNLSLKYLSLPVTRKYSRLKLCQFFFETDDFHNVFNKKTFWLNPTNYDDLKNLSYI